MRRDITLDGDIPQTGNLDIGSFFDVTKMSIVISDATAPDMPIIYVNRAFELSTGFSRSFALGRNCRFLQGEDTNRESVERIRSAITRGKSIKETLLNYRPDGSSFTNDLTLTPIHSKTGELVFYVGVQNIRGQASSNRPGFRQDESLISVVQKHISSHLDVILDISALVDDLDQQGNKTADFMRRINSLDVLYRDLGTHVAENDMVDLGAYVSHIASHEASQLAQFGVRVNINTDSVMAPIDYSVRLGLVLQEVLENALKHGFKGRDSGFVEVTLDVQDEHIHLYVHDDGIGFSDATDWPESDRYGSAVTRRLLRLTHSEIKFETSPEGTSVEIISPYKTNGLKGTDQSKASNDV